MNTVKAEIEIDGQHGPVVRVQSGGLTVAVYLADETAVVTTDAGQYGVEVSGPWHDFKAAISEAFFATGSHGEKACS